MLSFNHTHIMLIHLMWMLTLSAGRIKLYYFSNGSLPLLYVEIGKSYLQFCSSLCLTHSVSEQRCNLYRRQRQLSDTFSSAWSSTVYSTCFSPPPHFYAHFVQEDDCQENFSVASRVLIRRRTMLLSTRPGCHALIQRCCRKKPM